VVDTEGTVMFGLSPDVPTAVAPKGMLEPTVDGDPPGADPGEPAADMPESVLEDVAEPHPLETLVPPPSNAGFELALAQGSGLTPGVFNSVAPSGIPLEVGADVSENEDVPSGEVAPMPGVTADCACAAATTPRQIRICKASRDRIEGSQPMIYACDAGAPIMEHRNGQRRSDVWQTRGERGEFPTSPWVRASGFACSASWRRQILIAFAMAYAVSRLAGRASGCARPYQNFIPTRLRLTPICLCARARRLAR
jgi:hypothetical protein